MLRWQRMVGKRIDRLGKGCTVVAVDEAFLAYDTKKGKKHRPLAGKRVMQLYACSHKRAAPDLLFCEGQLVHAHRASRQITAKFGRVAVIADRYSAHFYVVEEFIRKNRKDRPERDVQTARFPASCPFLNAVEQCWSRLKRSVVVVVVGEHHASSRTCAGPPRSL